MTLGTFLVCGLVLTGVIDSNSEDKYGMIAHHVIQSISLLGSVASGYLLFKKKKTAKKPIDTEDEDDCDTNKLPSRPKTPRKPTSERRKPRKRS